MTDLTHTESIPTILVVDDDPTARLMLQFILRKEGFVVLTATNGLEGRVVAEREQPDLIIMDIKMPEEDGLTACAALKTNARTTSIPVVFVSWVEDVNSKIDGFNAGGVDYITKPYQVLEVIARVRLQFRLHHFYRSMVAASLDQLKNLSETQKKPLVQSEEYPEAGFAVFIFRPSRGWGFF